MSNPTKNLVWKLVTTHTRYYLPLPSTITAPGCHYHSCSPILSLIPILFHIFFLQVHPRGKAEGCGDRLANIVGNGVSEKLGRFRNHNKSLHSRGSFFSHVSQTKKKTRLDTRGQDAFDTNGQTERRMDGLAFL